MPKPTSVHQKAQTLALKYISHKYQEEYRAKYRELVAEMGGKLHPTKEQRIANLKAQIAELEARR
jgi:hypothetical protein